MQTRFPRWSSYGVARGGQRRSDKHTTNKHMKATLTTSQAAAMLKADTSANWSQSGAYALIEYLEQLEEDTGTEIEFDAVAIRCDYSEYESALQAANEYAYEPNPNLGDDEQSDDDKEADALAWLQDQTQVIEFAGGVIIQNF
jgi:hypothetical protein